SCLGEIETVGQPLRAANARVAQCRVVDHQGLRRRKTREQPARDQTDDSETSNAHRAQPMFERPGRRFARGGRLPFSRTGQVRLKRRTLQRNRNCARIARLSMRVNQSTRHALPATIVLALGIIAPPASSEFVFETAPFATAHASTIVETRDGLAAAWFG